MHFLWQHPQIGEKWVQSLKNWIFSIFFNFYKGDLSKTQWFRKWKWRFGSKWPWKPNPILHYNFRIVQCTRWGGQLEGVARLTMQSTYFMKATTKTTQSCFMNHQGGILQKIKIVKVFQKISKASYLFFKSEILNKF